MSTHLYLRCLSHDPPLESWDDVGDHLWDLKQVWADLRNRDEIVAEWTRRREDAWADDTAPPFDHHWRVTVARFFREHPHCEIDVIDEYGGVHKPSEEER